MYTKRKQTYSSFALHVCLLLVASCLVLQELAFDVHFVIFKKTATEGKLFTLKLPDIIMYMKDSKIYSILYKFT